MRSPNTACIGSIVIVSILLMTVGCSSPTTRIAFEAPSGSVLTVDGKPYHLPASVEVNRPSKTGESKRYDASLVATVRQQELRATGDLKVFGYTESDVDKMVTNTCYLTEDQLANLLNGNRVVFRGQSASRQPLYDLTLKK